MNRLERWGVAVGLRSLGEGLTAYIATITALGGLGIGHEDTADLAGLWAGHAQTAGGAAAGAAIILRVVLPALVRLSDKLRGVQVPDIPLDVLGQDLQTDNPIVWSDNPPTLTEDGDDD